MKQRDALEIFSFTNYYGAQSTTVLLNASNSVKYAVKTADIVKQHKRIETLNGSRSWKTQTERMLNQL
jgi:hypothetical protein